MVIKDEHYVSHEDEGDEVTNNDADLFREVEGRKRQVERHDCKGEKHLIDEDDVQDKVHSVNFK